MGLGIRHKLVRRVEGLGYSFALTLSSSLQLFIKKQDGDHQEEDGRPQGQTGVG